jgi:hypothetical protein
MLLTFASPTQWWIPLSTEHLNRADRAAAPNSRWQAYLNALTLEGLTPWITSLTGHAPHPLAPDYAALWTLVPGTRLQVGEKIWVLLPSEAMDDGEFTIPQEWVDLPGWVADYYLGVQVNVEANLVRVWCYTSHAQIRALGQWSGGDRSYHLSPEQIQDDLAGLWAMQQHYPHAITQSAVAAVDPLPEHQVRELLPRLQTGLFPRLALPFALWGALLENLQQRQQLCKIRSVEVASPDSMNLPVANPQVSNPQVPNPQVPNPQVLNPQVLNPQVPNPQVLNPQVPNPQIIPRWRSRLSDWLRGELGHWQPLEIAPPFELAPGWRGVTAPDLAAAQEPESPEAEPPIRLEVMQRIVLGDYVLRLEAEVVYLEDGDRLFTLRTRPQREASTPSWALPVGPPPLELKLLTPAQEELSQTRAAASEGIDVQLKGQRGERFILAIRCGQHVHREEFEL